LERHCSEYGDGFQYDLRAWWFGKHGGFIVDISLRSCLPSGEALKWGGFPSVVLFEKPKFPQLVFFGYFAFTQHH
jgi:hypothetical protein